MSGFQDFNGQPLTEGARITVDGAFATVTALSAPTNHGETAFFPPWMTVQFDVDGTEERLLCEFTDGLAIVPEDAHVLVSSPLFEMMHGLAKREWAREMGL